MRRAAAHISFAALLCTAFLPAAYAGSVVAKGSSATKPLAERLVVEHSPRTVQVAQNIANASRVASATQLSLQQDRNLDAHPYVTEFYGAAQAPKSAPTR